MTSNRLQTYWQQARTFIKEKWPRLSDTELDHINGDFDLFLEVLVNHYDNYPASEAEARQLLNRLFDQLDRDAAPDQR